MEKEAEPTTVDHVDKPKEEPDTHEARQKLTADAQQSAALAHSLSISEAIRAYPMALFWCFTISMCIIMEGYDQILVPSLFAYPTFQRKYGEFIGYDNDGNARYQLSAAWQAGLSDAAVVGALAGTLLNGYVVDIFGHRHVLQASLVAMIGSIFITFFSNSVAVLCVGQLIAGVPWGIFATVAPAYASECLPMKLRVYLTSWANMCFCIGQLIAAGVLRGLSSRTDEWGFRIPFALQWVWPIFLIPLLYFAPDSPWHEVRKGRIESAEKNIRRLQQSSTGIDAKQTLAEIIHTNNFEQEMSVGTTYWDCFKGAERRRTEIACMAFVGQVLSGSNFAYNSSYFFEQLGLDTFTVYSLSIGGLALAFLGTLINWFFCMPHFGRRFLYISGMVGMAIVLFIIGILNVWQGKSSVVYAQAGLAMFWNLVFDMTVGQLGWAIPAEIGSTRLRQKTICLARVSYYLVNIVAGVLQPYFMNPSSWNLRGYTGFFWGATAFFVFVWAYFRLPETKDRTYEELDMLFSMKVNAHKFKKTNVTLYGQDE
ncbi:hypothetical protein QQS21_009515 [Conoideocrella luteorostrata]|uniref:Major facilitator superfamily (MFS) profile domain-containing protein n=1 Tax=Conoideocrella luteorostrata TaxID=1105319 RepID=A0AAJ0CHP7_9HYPO|nr:hypothetical protein QQS21_009515 [Conoideocrella luteorostrata]